MSIRRLPFFYLPCIVAIVFSSPSFAANATVDCSNNNGQSFSSITAALNTLDLVGPNFITVSGVCHENVSIAQRDRLTIQAAPGQLATIENAASPAGLTLLVSGSHNITLTGLIVQGGALALYVTNGSSAVVIQNSTVQNSVGDGFDIDGQSSVLIQNSTIKNNAAAGIFISDYSQMSLATYPTQRIRITGNGFGGGGNGTGGLEIDGSQVQLNFGVLTIDGNAGPGISMEGGRLQLYGGEAASPGVIQNNNGGLMMSNAASATLWSAFTIRNNGSTGIGLTSSSALNFYPTVDSTGRNAVTSVTGHSVVGISMSQSSGAQLYGAQISKNGSGDAGSIGGISVSGSSLTIGGTGASVSDNTGTGIVAGVKSDLTLFDMTVSNNTLQGVLETNLSAGGFYEPLTFGQNGGGSVVCDDFSVAFGDVASIPGESCKNITSAVRQRPSFSAPKMR